MTTTSISSAIEVSGELDIAPAPQLDAALREPAARSALVRLDLQRLDFVAAIGWKSILRADRRIREAGGRLVVKRPPIAVWRVLTSANLDDTLRFGGGTPRPVERAPGEAAVV